MLTPELRSVIDADRRDLTGDFCRGCGYCMPCTAEIDLHNAARMSQLIRRSPSAQWLTPQWQSEMQKIENCVDCGLCVSRCPYGLDTPTVIRKNYEDYKQILAGEVSIE